MFKNLDAEQARFGKTDQNMADMLEISRVSYVNKKKSGKFNVNEAQRMCAFFGCSFEYLFATAS